MALVNHVGRSLGNRALLPFSKQKWLPEVRWRLVVWGLEGSDLCVEEVWARGDDEMMSLVGAEMSLGLP